LTDTISHITIRYKVKGDEMNSLVNNTNSLEVLYQYFNLYGIKAAFFKMQQIDREHALTKKAFKELDSTYRFNVSNNYKYS